MAKKIKASAKDHPYKQFIHSLNAFESVKPFIEQLQKNAPQIEKKISVEDCLSDLNANFEMLNTRLFFGMQINRLFAAKTNEESTDILFKKYQDIIAQDIVVTQASRTKLDPHCKSELDFSSAISHYKKWLLQLLFILFLTKPVEKFQYNDADLILYLLHIYQIKPGQTVSKVTLRSAAKIDADVVSELARNTEIHLHQHLSNSHWGCISLPHDGLQGYVPMAYIKVIF